MKDLQRTVAEFVKLNQLETNVGHRLFDLVSEVGELSKEVLKASEYGHNDFKPTAAWAEEIGDVFFSLICLANVSGVNLEEALQSVLAKYSNRIARTTKPSSDSA